VDGLVFRAEAGEGVKAGPFDVPGVIEYEGDGGAKAVGNDLAQYLIGISWHLDEEQVGLPGVEGGAQAAGGAGAVVSYAEGF
jgi:hypothetical protein